VHRPTTTESHPTHEHTFCPPLVIFAALAPGGDEVWRGVAGTSCII
jgi:hypothetical protein